MLIPIYSVNLNNLKFSLNLKKMLSPRKSEEELERARDCGNQNFHEETINVSISEIERQSTLKPIEYEEQTVCDDSESLLEQMNETDSNISRTVNDIDDPGYWLKLKYQLHLKKLQYTYFLYERVREPYIKGINSHIFKKEYTNRKIFLNCIFCLPFNLFNIFEDIKTIILYFGGNLIFDARDSNYNHYITDEEINESSDLYKKLLIEQKIIVRVEWLKLIYSFTF
ncbi:unnamed protein product [Brachionus calyciflorus]|uniref:BRCT domain-containing protein n=1 Tax=Brachionus calyciflorus TaxID=104777 RepID=A0A814BJK3_9BILA|nr:unnamed protein product [Brachionus calyciflorus]